MNTSFFRFLSAAALLAVLAACGNKGPLVLPQKPVPVEEPASPSSESPSGSDTDSSTGPARKPEPATR